MRLLIVGLGSMGRRRIRNLQYLKAGEIAGFDPRADRRDEATAKYGVRTFGDFEQALENVNPNALVISTPPDLHVKYAKIAVVNGQHFFSEASVMDDDLDELIDLARAHPEVVAAPSCTMRFHPSVQTIKRLVDAGGFGKPLLLTYQSGLWLPDWHPWEDYRSFYVARRATGACREIVPFELSWLTWIFGPVDLVTGMRGKLSSLDVDIDDAYQVLLRFRSGLLGHLLVDVISRAPVRSFRLSSDQATIEWDAVAKKVRFFRASTQEWEVIPEPEQIQETGYIVAENMYIEEMRDFVAACEGRKRWGYTIEQDKAILDLLSSIERSSDKHLQIEVGCEE
jgi:predicted dehydrogenase